MKKQVGDTLYSLRCIPIGGYCAMEGENEDTTYYVACVYQDHYKGYSYCYAVGYDPDGDFMTGEMANFLLMSVSVSGSPSHLSSADETGNAPERRITADNAST